MEGGDNIFLDAFDMADKFRAAYPDLFQTLTKVPATFQKVHYHRLERNAKLMGIFKHFQLKINQRTKLGLKELFKKGKLIQNIDFCLSMISNICYEEE